ncbi:AMP-binding protein [Streptomyces kutzneri]|uniref:AMP-binding protein n=1 Tax=Streptomyces kutzneri TaxID=3051179 RepID=UPI0028D0F1B1|nr:AMP-binding protein [Streptomyces sp. DSM 40907]
MDAKTGPALYGRFLRGLELSPDLPAFEAGAGTLTYTETHELALLWSGALAGAGARAVGVLAAKGPAAYAGILAALYAGAAVVPLRPDFPAARTRQMIDAAGVTAVIADERAAAGLGEVLEGRTDVAVLVPDRDRQRPVPFPVLDPIAAEALGAPRPVRPEDLAYVLFTSGSTGRPKGVTLTHAATDHYFGLLDKRYDFGPHDVFSQSFDLNFDCGVFDVFCAWGAGARLVAVPAQAYRDLPGFLAANGVTVWFSTPSAIDLVRRTSGLAEGALAGLRLSFFAGEAFTTRDASDWQRAAPASTVENLYGPTELTITIAGHRWSEELSPQLAVNGVVPIGTVHEGHHWTLLDERGEPDPAEGELVIAGPQLTPGYLDPADGEGRFLEREGRRWYRTGDRVRLVAHGELAYLGRLDSQVQIQGWRVELAEVEHALRDCPGLSDAVALGIPGAAGTELFVFYTGALTPPVELARTLRRTLPEGIVPRHYRRLDELPLNTNRKVDRKALAELAGRLLGARG